MCEPTDLHEHTWGPWTPRYGPHMPYWRGCLTCPEIEEQKK